MNHKQRIEIVVEMIKNSECQGEIPEHIAEYANENNVTIVLGVTPMDIFFYGTTDKTIHCDEKQLYLSQTGKILCYPPIGGCQVFEDSKMKEGVIEMIWDAWMYIWEYKTDVLHETFCTYERDDVSCCGIVF